MMVSAHNKIGIFFLCMTFVFLIAPIVIVIPLAFSSARSFEFPPPGFSWMWIKNVFSLQWTKPILFSAKLGIVSAILATVIALPAAIFFVRANIPGKWILYALIISPLFVPFIALAVGYYVLFGEGGFLNLLPAHVLLAIPFPFLSVSAALSTIDPNLERAGIILGARPVTAFLKIVVPTIKPAIIGGLLFAFLTSWDEVVFAVFITDPLTVTLPKKVWESIRLESDLTVAAISLFMLTFTATAIWSGDVMKYLRGKQKLKSQDIG